MVLDRGKEESQRNDRFRTTRWTLVLSSANAADGQEESRAALAELCRLYWQPIFTFICRRGNSTADAQDLTQDFFVVLLDGRLLQYADPERGRFRSLLLKALQNFLVDAHQKRQAKKRGGTFSFVSWDDWMTSAPSDLALPPQAFELWPAERLFDVRWAAAVVEHAMHRLREECEARGRGHVFDALRGLLSLDRTEVSYDEVAEALKIDPGAVKRLTYQLRRRYRALLRQEVAQTVADPSDIDDELRYLCSALAAVDE